LISIGSKVRIWHHARIEAIGTGAGATVIEIGNETVIQPYVHIGACTSVVLGRGVLIASFVYITDHDHDFADLAFPVVSSQRVVALPVAIGDYAWLGERAIVLKGVHIGERSIIGAGSVVTRDVPPYSIAVGVPARVVKRFDCATQKWVNVLAGQGTVKSPAG